MPEGFDRQELTVGKEFSKLTDQYRGKFVPKKVLLKIIERGDARFIDYGNECVVFQTGERKRSRMVVAINYRNPTTPEKAKKIFYLQRVLSTLFPHNFPRFYAATGKHPARKEEMAVTGTIREEKRGKRIRPERIKDTEQERGILRTLLGKGVKHPFGRVLQTCKELSLPVSFDPADVNYIIGKDGGVYYLDVPLSEYGGEWKIPKILQYMDRATTSSGEPIYQKKDRQIVLRSIQRLAELGPTKITQSNN